MLLEVFGPEEAEQHEAPDRDGDDQSDEVFGVHCQILPRNTMAA